jgi:predicted secreted protein
MTEAISAFGTKLSWNGADVAELTSISGPNETMDTIDVTSHDSPDAYREFIAGIRDGGEISIEGNFIKTDTTGQIALHNDFQAGTKRAWIIKFPGGSTQISGNGFITAFSPSFPFEDKIGFTATIKVTGKPALSV